MKKKNNSIKETIIAVFLTLVLFILPCVNVSAAKTKDGFTYSGQSYYAVVQYNLNLRDNAEGYITTIQKESIVYVRGIYSKNSERVVVEYISGKSKTVGTVLEDGLEKTLAYSGTSYNAITECALKLRTDNGTYIKTVPQNNSVLVRGTFKKDTERAVIEWKDSDGIIRIGTVLESCLKKSSNESSSSNSSSNSGSNSSSSTNTVSNYSYSKYSGSGYKAITADALVLRDNSNQKIKTVPQNAVVEVIGLYNKNTDRAVVKYGSTYGTVLASYLELFHSGSSYYGRTTTGLNFRTDDGSLIETIPTNSLVEVKGVSRDDSSRVVVNYYGVTGTILKEYVKIVSDAIFVSIDHQIVTQIKDGKLLCQGECVTGLAGVMDTPKGAYSIYKMAKDYTLRGKNLDGTSYAQPVSYWMPFYEGYGLHDATWQPSFGGTAYMTRGSHGCVNLPLSLAKTIFNRAYVGYPVYVS